MQDFLFHILPKFFTIFEGFFTCLVLQCISKVENEEKKIFQFYFNCMLKMGHFLNSKCLHCIDRNTKKGLTKWLRYIAKLYDEKWYQSELVCLTAIFRGVLLRKRKPGPILNIFKSLLFKFTRNFYKWPLLKLKLFYSANLLMFFRTNY